MYGTFCFWPHEQIELPPLPCEIFPLCLISYWLAQQHLDQTFLIAINVRPASTSCNSNCNNVSRRIAISSGIATMYRLELQSDDGVFIPQNLPTFFFNFLNSFLRKTREKRTLKINIVYKAGTGVQCQLAFRSAKNDSSRRIHGLFRDSPRATNNNRTLPGIRPNTQYKCRNWTNKAESRLSAPVLSLGKRFQLGKSMGPISIQKRRFILVQLQVKNLKSLSVPIRVGPV